MDKSQETSSAGAPRDSDVRSLDRTSPMPLWAQLVEELTRRMTAGDFAERLPTDQELMNTYKVSRQTARDAVRRLGESFRLERHRGKGTFVRQAQFEQPVGTMYSWFQAIEGQGAKQDSVVRACELRQDAIVAAELDVDSDLPLFYLERLRLADGVPLALDRIWMPAVLAAPLMGTDFTHTALYDELRDRAGITPTRGQETIHPVIPIPSVAKLLEMPKGAAAFTVVRRTWIGDRPLERRDTIVRGDRHAFVSSWSQGPGIHAAEPLLKLVAHT
ncbi:MAG: GntR family transcriptional regulator [Actinomycetota bacterium]